MDGSQWPLLLYEDHQYDMDDPWKGFMRSELLVRVCCETEYASNDPTHSFTGLQSYFYFAQCCHRGEKGFEKGQRRTRRSVQYHTVVLNILRNIGMLSLTASWTSISSI